MNPTQNVLLLFIVVLFIYATYNEVIINWRKGTTLLKVPLLRHGRLDGLIFIGLIVIVLWHNISNQGSTLNNWLLAVLALLALYLSWLRQPKILFKQQGFFFHSLWINYQQIQEMNLSEDGVLLVRLEKRKLFIRVRNIDDLEKIYKLLVTIQ